MFQRTRAIIIITTKRILAQPGLALATVVGLIVVIALTMSIPLYADAVYYRVFFEDILQDDVRSARPPFSLIFQYRGSHYGPLQWEDIQQVDRYLNQHAAADISLPETLRTQHVTTEPMGMYVAGETSFVDRNLLKWIAFSYIRDLQDHITILEGRFPAVVPPEADSTVEVLISEAMALELGLQVDEAYLVFARDRNADGLRLNTQIPVRIVGVWRASDLDDPFWFMNPKFLDDELIVPEATFAGRISAAMPDEVETATWYRVLDSSGVNYDASATLIAQMSLMEQTVNSLLPETRLVVSPRDNLRQYQAATELLTVLLLAFSIPVIGLLLAFIILASSLAVERQQNEIAVLRSRGATVRQIISVAILQATLLGLIAWLLSVPLSAMIAGLIGRSRSFLDLTGTANLQINQSATTLAVGLATVGFAIVAQVLPTLRVSGYTIITYKQAQARSSRPPLWQRLWLDVLLIVPTAYGIFLLQRQGSILDTGAGDSSIGDNPLLFLVPALAILTSTLLVLRLVPILFRTLAWLMARTGSVATLLATRHLARTPGFYSAPLALLILTLSLSAFTASLAQTLDSHLRDQTYYGVGADLEFFEFGEALDLNLIVNGDSSTSDDSVIWRFLPVSEYLNVPGVEAATRVGRYDASTSLEGRVRTGTFLGVDRFEFARVAFWRDDFARHQLNALMNALALAPEGVLLPDAFMRDHALTIGDTIRITVRVVQRQIVMDLEIIGSFDLFPSWYPEQGPLFVGNLDYFFEQVGGNYPYHVWFAISASTDPQVVGQQFLASDTPVSDINTARARPERRGLLGLLSIGFGAAAVLTVIGFLLYILFSFRRRMIEIGVLRAVGLASWQMAALLAWELLSLIALGGLIGTGIGTLASQVFIPFLQIGTDPASITPPFIVQIAWPALLRIYVLFGLLFALALAGLVLLLRRLKIFQAIKLGETV